MLTPFAIWLRAARGESSQDRLSQACRAIDKKCGIYQARFNDWEQGRGCPTLRQLVVICGALGLNAEETKRARELRDDVELENLPTVPDAT